MFKPPHLLTAFTPFFVLILIGCDQAPPTISKPTSTIPGTRASPTVTPELTATRILLDPRGMESGVKKS